MPCYTVEQREDHYYVVGAKGVVASYLDFEKAAREFAYKCLPAMRAARRKLYHASL